eukprot:38052_1
MANGNSFIFHLLTKCKHLHQSTNRKSQVSPSYILAYICGDETGFWVSIDSDKRRDSGGFTCTHYIWSAANPCVVEEEMSIHPAVYWINIVEVYKVDGTTY